MNWFVEVLLKKYARFGGRAGRREFWHYTLVSILVVMVLAVIDAITGTYSLRNGLGLLSGVFTVATLVPTIAVMARRLHDSDHSGWWVLGGLLPVLGALVLLVFALLRGSAGDNRFGAVPPSHAG